MTTYRLDRAPALAAVGVLVILAAVGGFVAFVATSTVAGVLTLLLLLAAALLAWRPPVVARLDEHGLRIRRGRTLWTGVEDVRVTDNTLLLTLGPEGDDQQALRLSLAAVGRRTPELLREVHDRLNTAHGYRRFE